MNYQKLSAALLMILIGSLNMFYQIILQSKQQYLYNLEEFAIEATTSFFLLALGIFILVSGVKKPVI
jgi:hypothetical protein